MPVADRAGDDDGVGMAVVAMMPGALAVVVKGDRTVVAVMKAVAILIDHDCGTVMIMMPVMRPDDDIGLGRGSDGGSGDTKRQGSDKHCFHCSIPDF